MKVAVDISPLKTGHQTRGIGSYTRNLQKAFQKNSMGVDFEFFEDPKSPPRADIVHYPYFDLFKRTLPIKKTAKRVVTIHDVIPLVFPNYFPAGIRGYINLFFQKIALKNCDAVLCDSKTSKADIVDKLSIPASKIHVVYLAPPQIFHKIADGLSIIAKKYSLPEKFVLYVGDVNWNKNIHSILEAVKISKKKLVLVGKAFIQKDLRETREIDKTISKLKIKNSVIKTGFVPDEDLVKIYNLASVTVLPSFYEGFGLPVLESMACGTPVVTSSVSSLSEIAGENAFFCNPSDPNDIAKKIDKVFSLSQKQKDALSEKLIVHALRFSWDKVARETVSIYKRLAR